MSMAHSLEARVPYLDRALVELAARLPSDLKLRRFTKKYVLKQDGRDLMDTMLLAKFDAKHVELDLCLVAEVPKG